MLFHVISCYSKQLTHLRNVHGMKHTEKGMVVTDIDRFVNHLEKRGHTIEEIQENMKIEGQPEGKEYESRKLVEDIYCGMRI